MGADMALSRVDRGPWLYRERRISRGREFELLKFRTLKSEVLEREGLETELMEHDESEAGEDIHHVG